MQEAHALQRKVLALETANEKLRAELAQGVAAKEELQGRMAKEVRAAKLS